MGDVEAVRRELAHHLGAVEERLVGLDRRLRAADRPALDGLLLAESRRCALHVAELSRRLDRAPGPELAHLASVVRALYGLVAGVEGAGEWHSPPSRSSVGYVRGSVPVLSDHDYQRA